MYSKQKHVVQLKSKLTTELPMGWFRRKKEVYIRDLLVLAQESAFHFADTARKLRNEDLMERMENYSKERMLIVASIAGYQRSRGKLPTAADPDVEWFTSMIDQILSRVSADEDKAILERQLAREDHISEVIAETRTLRLNEKFKPIFLAFAEHNEKVRRELRNDIAEGASD